MKRKCPDDENEEATFDDPWHIKLGLLHETVNIDMSQLPAELLQKVISYLSWREQLVVERVSLRWRAAVQACMGRRRALCSDAGDPFWAAFTDATLEKLLNRMPELREIDLGLSGVLKNPLDINIVAQHCRQLTRICLRPFRVTDVSLRRLCLSCPRLHAVRVHPECTDLGVTVLLCLLPGLRELDLSVSNVVGVSFSLLPAGLERLSVSHCVHLRLKSLGRPARHCVALRDLVIDFRGLPSRPGVVGRLLGAYVSKQWPHLERLVLSYCDALGSAGVRYLAYCTRLRELQLACGQAVKVEDLAAGLAGSAHCLEKLTLDCPLLTDTLEKGLPPAGLPSLRCLDGSIACNVSSDALRKLPRLLPGLHTLSLNVARNLERDPRYSVCEEGLMHLANFRVLLELNLCGQVNVTDRTLEALQRCTTLTTLHLGCVGTVVYDEAITRLVLGCPKLTFLEIMGISEDAGAVKLYKVVGDLWRQLTTARDVTLSTDAWFVNSVPFLPTGPLRLKPCGGPRHKKG